jgi:hypothetical protein
VDGDAVCGQVLREIFPLNSKQKLVEAKTGEIFSIFVRDKNRIFTKKKYIGDNTREG